MAARTQRFQPVLENGEVLLRQLMDMNERRVRCLFRQPVRDHIDVEAPRRIQFDNAVSRPDCEMPDSRHRTYREKFELNVITSPQPGQALVTKSPENLSYTRSASAIR